jgi:tetratricopeptide (TPR) repeat protein
MKDYENAKKYILKGLKGIKETEDKYWEAYGYWYLGRLYRDKKNKKMAEKYFTRAYDLFQSIGAEEKAQGVLNEMKKIK